MQMHLTNYAINKSHPDFTFEKEDDEEPPIIAHKRSLDWVYSYLEGEGCDVVKLKSEIDIIITNTL
jgi:hypothetical protein